jgi:hypothetical protein
MEGVPRDGGKVLFDCRDICVGAHVRRLYSMLVNKIGWIDCRCPDAPRRVGVAARPKIAQMPAIAVQAPVPRLRNKPTRAASFDGCRLDKIGAVAGVVHVG